MCMLESDPVLSGFNPKVLAIEFFQVNVQRKYGVFIANDQEQHKPANHWVALSCHVTTWIIFFDLFAKLLRHYYVIGKHLHKMKRKIIINRMMLQGPLSNVCGVYIFWVLFMSKIQTWRYLAKILVLMKELYTYRDKSFFQTISEHCNFISGVYSSCMLFSKGKYTLQ